MFLRVILGKSSFLDSSGSILEMKRSIVKQEATHKSKKKKNEEKEEFDSFLLFCNMNFFSSLSLPFLFSFSFWVGVASLLEIFL